MFFTMQVKYKYLFNFSVSYMGGGFKRLYEYAKWFNENGGAWFIIHPRCKSLVKEFQNNHFFLVTQPGYQRIFNDCAYLSPIKKEIDSPDLYYSYGIPIYRKFGKVNWFHLSNILPLGMQGIPLSLFDRIKLSYLGRQIKRNFQNMDIISAESNYSLSLFDRGEAEKLFLSVNGSDDELMYYQSGKAHEKDNIATVLGTQKYKLLKDSYHVFEMLREYNNQLKLVIIGNLKGIPEDLRTNRNVIIKGMLTRQEVVKWLKKTKYYISTTCIENSYNASSEGVLFADESYISDIGPHRELLMNTAINYVSIPKMQQPIIHVKNKNVLATNLKTWDQINVDMINKTNNQLQAKTNYLKR